MATVLSQTALDVPTQDEFDTAIANLQAQINAITPAMSPAWHDVRAWGAVGDGQADDAPAIQAAIDDIAVNGGGKIVFPRGDYRCMSALRIQDMRNVHMVGAGGSSNNPGTRLIYEGSEAVGLLKLQSAIVCSFTDIQFLGKSPDMHQVILINAYDAPKLSSLDIDFRRCTIRTTGAYSDTAYGLIAENVVGLTLDKCWLTTADKAARIGENNGATGGLANGAANRVEFRNCFVTGDVHLRNCMSTAVWHTQFDAKFNGDPAIINGDSGDAMARGIGIYHCWGGFGNAGTGRPFFTQGANGQGLVAMGNRLSLYGSAFYLNGLGRAHLSANVVTGGMTLAVEGANSVGNVIDASNAILP